MQYSNKLKDPRWQKKRLEILERDEWACRICGDTESPIAVHHYKYCGEPWEVDENIAKFYLESLKAEREKENGNSQNVQQNNN